MSSPTTTAIATITDQAVISSYNRGPILTPYTAPTSCTATPTFGEGMYVGHWGSGYGDPACFPSSTGVANARPTMWDIYYYSPAICPYAWSTVSTWTSTYGGVHPTVLSIGPETTVALCCPNSFTYDNDYHRCYTEFASKTTVFLYLDPATDAAGNWYPAATSITTVAVARYSIYADGVPVWYQNSDLALFAAATRTSTTSPSTSTISATSSVTTSTTSTPTPTPTSSLSNGAKIGIGIGIPVVAVAAIAAVAFFWFRKRKGMRRVIPQQQQEEGEGGYFSSGQNVMSELSSQRPRAELQAIYRLRYDPSPGKEKPSPQLVSELP